MKAIKLVKSQEKAFKKKIPFAVLFTRTSAAIRPRSLLSIEAEFAEKRVPMFGTQIHEREAYRAVFAFGGTLAGLDPTQVANLPAVRNNARAFAAETIETLNLRHSLSNWLVNKGKVDPKTVQGVLRHSKIQTTLDLYTQEDSDETRTAQGSFLSAMGMRSGMVN